MTSQTHSLRIGYVADSALILPDDPYWLTITQQVEDDLASAAESAELIDDIYDNDACRDTGKSGKESDTDTKDETQSEDDAEGEDITPKTEEEIAAAREKLRAEVQKKWGNKVCGEDTSGDYTADVEIIRSHPEEPYTLKLSTTGIFVTQKKEGPQPLSTRDGITAHVAKIIVVSKQVTVNVDVKSVSSVVLPYPVTGNDLAASWAGSPVFADAAGADATIYALHNTLYWSGSATGTITATYSTIYEVVTISVPGLQPKAGEQKGESPDCSILAFYHRKVYQATVKAPPKKEDSEQDSTPIEYMCSFIFGQATVIPPPKKAKKDETVYGCLFDDPALESELLYSTLCCKAGKGNSCGEWTAPKPAKGLSKEAQEMIRANHPDYSMDFVAIPPCGTEGCGHFNVHPSVYQHNCCDKIQPMAWNAGLSAQVISPGSSAGVAVSGGLGPYYWTIGGQGFSLGGDYKRAVTTDFPYVRVAANSSACGFAPITVQDTCSIVEGGIRSTLGKWVQDLSAAPCSVRGTTTLHYNEAADEIRGQYRIKQTCLGPIESCFVACSGAPDLAAFIQTLCAAPGGHEPPCFPHAPLPGSIASGSCADPTRWWEIISTDKAVAVRNFLNYELWRWRCS
jgi:hypothetical protein